MKIPEYARQTKGITVVNNAPKMQPMQVNQRAVDAMFKNPNSQAMQGIAKGLMDVSNTATTIGDGIQNTNAQDAAMKFEQGFMEWQSEARQKKGKDGMNAADDYETWKTAKYAELSKGLNDVEAARFQRKADQHSAGFANWSADYGSGQRHNYEAGVFEATLATQRKMILANIDDPVLVQSAMLEGGSAIKSWNEKNGVSSEKTALDTKDFMNSAVVPAVEMKISEGKVGQARALMDTYKHGIGEREKTVLNSQMEREIKRQAAEARSARAEAQRQAVKSEIPYVLETYGDNLNGAVDYLKNKYGDDYETIGRVYNSVTGVMRMEQSAEDYNTKIYNDAKLKSFEQNIYNPDITPTQASQMLIDLPPEVQAKGEQVLKRRFAPEGSFVSDPTILQQTKEAVLTGQSVDWMDKRNYLSSKDLYELQTKEKDIKSKAASTNLRPNFYTQLKNFGMEGLPEKYNLNKKDMYNMFVSDAYEAGITDPLELEKYMQDWLRKATVNQVDLIFYNQYTVPKGLGSYMVGEDEDFSFVNTAPVNKLDEVERKQIIEALEKEGRPVNEDNINTVYMNKARAKGQ